MFIIGNYNTFITLHFSNYNTFITLHLTISLNAHIAIIEQHVMPYIISAHDVKYDMIVLITKRMYWHGPNIYQGVFGFLQSLKLILQQDI